MRETFANILAYVWFALIVVPYLIWQAVSTVQLVRYLWRYRKVKMVWRKTGMATESVG